MRLFRSDSAEDDGGGERDVSAPGKRSAAASGRPGRHVCLKHVFLNTSLTMFVLLLKSKEN